MTESTIKTLIERIKPLMDAVDLDNLSLKSQGNINAAELSGTDLDGYAKRLMALLSDGVISSEETLLLGDYFLEIKYG